MVIELVAGRILAPYIGVSLFTWTSIIGVILAGIALGNYLGGKAADRYPSPHMLTAIFFAGSLFTIAVPAVTKLVATAPWFGTLPLMLNFTLRTFCVFFLPAVVLSMVSPYAIKLTLSDLRRTGGVVGSIYAFSTMGSILGTFMTGFYLIPTFGVRSLVWLVGAVLLLTGIASWLAWRVSNRWRPSVANVALWAGGLLTIAAFVGGFQLRERWQEHFIKESNYYSIKVLDSSEDKNVKVLVLDRLVHSYSIPDDPLYLKYDYLKIFTEAIGYISRDNPAPRVVHLGGGGYSLPRYLEAVYPQSTNDVVEIDPAVTLVAQQNLGLSPDSKIRTYNRDARLYLSQRDAKDKYDIAIGDVFNDFSTPYHLTTLEFARLVKANLKEGGIYMVNIIDDSVRGRYMPSLAYTLLQAFDHVFILNASEDWQRGGTSTYVIAATDMKVDALAYREFVTAGGTRSAAAYVQDELNLKQYLQQRNPVLLTDNYAPTDAMVAPLIR